MSERVTFKFKARDAWMRALASAAELSWVTRVVGIRLALHLDCSTGRCNPAYATLAREVSIERRNVIRAVAALEAAQWVVVTHSGGGPSANTNQFQLVMPGGVSPVTPVEVSTEPPLGVSKTTSRGVTTATRGVSLVTPNKRKEISEEIREESLSPDSGFAEFWRQYPKHKDKGAAERAYRKAIRNGAKPAQLINGALRYAAERADKDEPQYTKHAATWLNARSWEDEPDLPTPRSGGYLASIQRGLDMIDDDEELP